MTGLLRTDRTVGTAAWLSIVGVAWFVCGPEGVQRPAFRALTPLFAGMIAVGQWRIGGSHHRTPAAARFWRILSLGMFLFTAGMLVDFATLVFEFPVRDIGETLLYPVAGAFIVVALTVVPTVAHGGAQRLRMALDVATVLFGSATFAWYFLISRRWRPAYGWHELSDGVVLPALMLVCGFVVLRIMTAGVQVINKSTVVCFVFGAVSAAISIVIGAPIPTTAGRFSSVIYVGGLFSCVVGVGLQRASGPPPNPPRHVAWHRPFTVLPYGAIVATLGLLLIIIEKSLDYRGWVVVAGVVALYAAVIARQVASLWENSRLLAANAELTNRLRHQAYHDHLTGLANRAFFTDRVSAALAAAARDGTTVAVLFVDLDDFKIVNDSLGHQVGDELLVAVAERLRHTVPPNALLGRLGGDEFAVLLVEPAEAPAPTAIAADVATASAASDGGATASAASDATATAEIAQRVIAEVGRAFSLSGMSVRVQASVGIATATGEETDAARLLRNADVAMYSAKNAHKGASRTFEPVMLTAVLRRHRMQAALARAVERGEFAVYFQPIVDLGDGSLHGAEALVRWLAPDGGLVGPNEFIPLAEETGLVTEIDRWVLEHACQHVRRWRTGESGERPFALHVNLSARHLHRAGLVDDVAGALRRSRVAPGCLTLEITESGLGHDHETAIARLTELAGMGVRLAIDDFGTGYSSLAYLRHMPVDVLKMDKTFTAELSGAAPAPLAQAVIALAAALGMETVAEGIEEPAQAERLRALGCRYGQGYHYARPLSPIRMERFLARSRAGGLPDSWQ